MNNHTIYDIALSFEDNISAVDKVLLHKRYVSSENIYKDCRGIYSSSGRKITLCEGNIGSATDIMCFLDKSGINTFRYDEIDYPLSLQNMPDKPFMIFTRGDSALFKKRAVSVVGTRTPATVSLQLTELIAALLVRKGYVVVSGLAKGIDEKAHVTTLDVSGKTIGVLGSGIDTVYPASSKPIVKRMIAGDNLIVSEYPPGVIPYKSHFPQRNRIIAGLSLLTVLIQAPERSGSLITAKLTLDYNKELLVYKPYDYDRSFHGNVTMIDDYTANTFSDMSGFMNYLECDMPVS